MKEGDKVKGATTNTYTIEGNAIAQKDQLKMDILKLTDTELIISSLPNTKIVFERVK